ncbi:metal-dependent transcriptional regulator [bacterium]|nr:metal-dependent transcriptional regulator [bacterium]
MEKKLSSTMEDYLEVIAVLKKQNDVVRVRDIGRLLGVKSSSVNAALRTLSKKSLAAHEKYGYVKLTPTGEKIARNIQSKHDLLLKFLTEILDINDDEALQDACKMEHAISSKTFNRLTKFIRFVETGLNGERPQWLKSFKHYLKTGKKPRCKMRQLAEKKR